MGQREGWGGERQSEGGEEGGEEKETEDDTDQEERLLARMREIENDGDSSSLLRRLRGLKGKGKAVGGDRARMQDDEGVWYEGDELRRKWRDVFERVGEQLSRATGFILQDLSYHFIFSARLPILDLLHRPHHLPSHYIIIESSSSPLPQIPT